MISRANADFWACFNALPAEIQRLARDRFHLWQEDAFNVALHFKPLFADVWSVRVNQNYRALGRLVAETSSSGSGLETTRITTNS